MSYFDWALVIGFLSLLFGPFVVPLMARFVFKHQGVWLYRVAKAGRWMVGCLFLLLAYMDVQYFAGGYGPDLAYHDRLGFISQMSLNSIGLFICWAPWGRILNALGPARQRT